MLINLENLSLPVKLWQILLPSTHRCHLLTGGGRPANHIRLFKFGEAYPLPLFCEGLVSLNVSPRKLH